MTDDDIDITLCEADGDIDCLNERISDTIGEARWFANGGKNGR